MKLIANPGVGLSSIIRDAERSVASIDQSINQILRWNRLHPEETPIDPDPDGELAAIKAYAQAIIRECRRPRGIGEPIIVRVPVPQSVKEKIEEIQKEEAISAED